METKKEEIYTITPLGDLYLELMKLPLSDIASRLQSAEKRIAAALEELGDGSQVGSHGVLCRAVIEEKSGDPQISGDACCCAFGRLRAILEEK